MLLPWRIRPFDFGVALALVLQALWVGEGCGGSAGLAESRPGQPLLSTPAEITEALKSARPGDTLVMANGVWRDADILFEGQGAPCCPITLRAQTPGRVVLTGESRLRIAGRDLVVDGLWFKEGTLTSGNVVAFRRDPSVHSSDCRLTNSAITDYNPVDRERNYKWVSLYGTRNRVDHCYFKGQNHTGQTVVVWVSDEPNEHRIDHNYFAGRPRLGWNGGETLRVGTSEVAMNNSRTVVEYNYFENCDGEGEIVSNKSCENIYRYNTFVESAGALTLRHGKRCTVEGNYFFGRGKSLTGGVRVIGEDHRVINNYFEGLTGSGFRSALSMMNGIPDTPPVGYEQVKRTLIAFNTFVNCTHNFIIGLGAQSKGQSLPPDGCTIANNIVLGSEGPLIEYQDEPISLTWRGNIMHGALLGIEDVTGIGTVDPKLVLDAVGIWRPVQGSPAIGAAEGEYPFVTEDIEGQPRGATKDVGCDQVSGEPRLRRPLTPEDVGPDWSGGF